MREPPVRYQFVDCRYDIGDRHAGRRMYASGHIPGASFLDLDEDLAAPPAVPGGRHPLPDPEAFAVAAGRAGIGADTAVVAYDQGTGGGAARLWWLLRHFGHERAAVLAGGIGAWLGPLAAGEEPIEPRTFEARPRRDDVMDADELLARLDDPRLLVLDTRSPARFGGEPSPLDPGRGHIPGARSLFYESTGPLPNEVLAAPEIVTYCGSGVTACVVLLRLAQAGRTDAKLYPGSWSDWARRGLVAELPEPATE
jgi:thiosulfate/3-mercaptopyruvate sulfurtransferase